MWKFCFTRGQLKKIKSEKKMSNQRHVSEFAKLVGRGEVGWLEKKITRMHIKPKIL